MSGSLAVLIGVATGATLSMVVFAVGHRNYRDPDASRKGSRFLLGTGDFLLHWLMWAIGPVERLLLRLQVGPNSMNAGGLFFGLASGILIGLGHLEAGGWAILLAGACDILDGRLARARGVSSDYGKFIDSTLDRFVETFAYLGFAVRFGRWPWGPLIVAAALGGSLLVSYAQARGESVRVSGSGGLMQRAERLVLTSLACLLDGAACHAVHRTEGTLVVAVLALVAVGAFGTAVHRTVWIARRLRS